MKILVCGGAGFIGSAYVKRKLADNPADEVVCLDALTYAGNMDNLAPVADDPRFTFVHGDICDRNVVTACMAGVDAVVNFAAETHVDRSIVDPEAFIRTDVLGTHVLLQGALEAGVARFVQVSTDEVYGSIDSGSFVESESLSPSSPYSASKAAGDLQALAYYRTFGLPVMVTRGSNTYGPNQYPEKLIPLFVTNALEGERMPLYGDGKNVRDWIHVEDHCSGIDFVLENGAPGEVYNIGGGNERTNLEITRIITDELGVVFEEAVDRVADRPGHDRRYSVDSAKLRALGWSPKVDFEAGIVETVDWYRRNAWWWHKIKHGEGEFAAWRERWYGA